MQFAVAGFRYLGYKNLKKTKKIKTVTLFVLIAIIITLIITFFVLINHSKYDYIFSKKLYYLSFSKSKNSKQVNEIQSKVKAAGGAGYVLINSDVNYVLAFGYFNQEDASAVRDSNLDQVSTCEVIERVLPDIKNKIKKQILANTDYKNVFKCLYDAENEIYNICISYDSAQINVSGVMNNLVKHHLLFQEIMDNIKLYQTSNMLFLSIKEQIFTTLNVINDVFSYCKASIYKGENVKVAIKYLFLTLCETELDLRLNLNKL